MATPPKKPSKPLYAKGTAPEMGVPPVIKRGNRGPIPTVHTVEYGSYPEDMKPGDIVHHSNSVNLSAASRKEKVASHVSRRIQVGDDARLDEFCGAFTDHDDAPRGAMRRCRPNADAVTIRQRRQRRDQRV